MTRVAVIGAGGFVGARLVEMSVLRGGTVDGCKIIPVFRQPRSLGRLSRFGPIGYRLADASEPTGLAEALAGCDVAVNLTMGDNRRIVPDLVNLYAACASAGVGTVIHVSSAEVFGRADRPNLTDDSDWARDHWMPYARAKGKAEDWVRRLESGPTNVVVLRPGLIWGPRSPWVAGPAVDIDRGVAYLFDGGRGACNLMYVDNLCYSITAVARRGGPTAFYNVGDPDRPDWSAYYRGLARVVGRADVPIHGLDAAQFRASLGERLEFLKETSAFRYLKKRLRGATKAAIKHHLGRLRESGVPHAPAGSPRPRPTRSMWWLQTVRSWLPTQRFDTTYPIAHRLSFGEALERTGAWLRFAGFGC